MKTPAEANKLVCHVGAGNETAVICRADLCMAWRWEGFLTDAAWVAAVQKRAADSGDKTQNRAKSAKYVNDNRAEFGLPTAPFRGWCGLVSKPE